MSAELEAMGKARWVPYYPPPAHCSVFTPQVSAELEAMGKASFYYGEVGLGSHPNPNPDPDPDPDPDPGPNPKCGPNRSSFERKRPSRASTKEPSI